MGKFMQIPIVAEDYNFYYVAFKFGEFYARAKLVKIVYYPCLGFFYGKIRSSRMCSFNKLLGSSFEIALNTLFSVFVFPCETKSMVLLLRESFK